MNFSSLVAIISIMSTTTATTVGGTTIPAAAAATATGGSTVIVGLNAALQKRFILPQDRLLIPGDVHRATQVQAGVGGKGQDVAIALSCLKYSEPIKLAQFIGRGAAGDAVYDLLKQVLIGDDDNDDNDTSMFDCTVRSQSALRICTSIVASDKTTELVEPSGMISPSEYEELFEKLSHVKVDALCVMGSMPPGCSEDTYGRIYDTLVEQRKSKEEDSQALLCLIDSVCGLDSIFQAIGGTSTTNRKTILKINASELCRLSGTEKSKVTETGGIETEELILAIRAFLQKWPHARGALDAMAITDGSHSAYFFALPPKDTESTTLELYQIPVGSLDNTGGTKIYPIGAGDAVAAGTLAAWYSLSRGGAATPKDGSHSLPKQLHEKLLIETQKDGSADLTSSIMRTSFAFGIACGTASCLQDQNSVLELSDVEQMFDALVARPLMVSCYSVL